MPEATLVRPWAVFLAQLRANWLCWTKRTRILTYTEGLYLGPLALKLHYLQIELEDGTVLYRSPKISASELATRVASLKEGLSLLLHRH